ncbi:MAG: protein kinase [Polyangiales bacterium]
MGSPGVLATCVIALTLIVGGLSTWANYRALYNMGEQRAGDALDARAKHLRGALAAAIDPSEALLDLLVARVRDARNTLAEPLLVQLRELAVGRPGITWISASFPSGSFVGVRVDDAGVLHGRTSFRGVRGDYDFAADGTPSLVGLSNTTYDPRERDFYKLAVARGRRTWSEPYRFYQSHRTGISRIEPTYASDGTLAGVVTVDFDATGLTPLVPRLLIAGQRELVLTADGSVLASAGLALPPPARFPESRTISFRDLDDPAVRAASTLIAPGAPDGNLRLRVDDQPFRLQQARVAQIGAAPITLVNLLPERALFARARAEALRGLVVTVATALLGLGLSLLLSTHIARLRRKRVEAERAAARAREEVAELGSYQLLERLGSGGMGNVYRARHTLLARDAALKLIHTSDDADDEDAREALFFHEAQVLASMRSPHTVAVYDFGIADDGRYFLAMELLDGLDLDVLVRQHGPQPAARVAAMLAQACESLAEAHAHGLVHRDVKPANVFLCRLAASLDVIKVLDFGLTRAVGSGPRADTVEGTPEYMAPEQALGVEVGPASDLYSLGCVGFWLLSGRPPYAESDPDLVMDAHVSAPIPELPEAIRAQTPPGLVQLLTRCMAKRPDHRPTSADALARALRRIAIEHAESFSESMQAAFWAARDARAPTARVVSETQPMLSVGRRRDLREAS